MPDEVNQPTPETPTLEAWDRLDAESAAAYAAFCYYYNLPPRDRSIRAAFQLATLDKARSRRDRQGIQISEEEAAAERERINAMKPPGKWREWSVQHSWVKRAAAWDVEAARRLEELWIARREELRRMDWDLGDQLRSIVVEGLVEARGFVREHVTRIEGTNGQPATVIVTRVFDVTDLALVAEKSSKLQRLATGEATENMQWKGTALDRLIERELARLANGGETGDVGGITTEEANAE